MSLPVPSPRNVEIHQLVTYDGYSLRQVAAIHELSANRVVEIVQQVERWYRESTPDWAAGLAREQQAIAAWRVHAERLQHLYCETMQAWRESQGKQTIEQQRWGGGGATSTTMTRFGDVRYLSQASRISRETAQAAVSFAKLPARWFDPTQLDGADEAAEIPVETIAPPTGVLARETEPSETTTPAGLNSGAVKVAHQESCDVAAQPTESLACNAPPSIDPVRLLRKQRQERHKQLERKFAAKPRRSPCVG
jgi:hypothetical protein